MNRAPHSHHDWAFYIGLNIALAGLIAVGAWYYSSF